MSKHNYQLINPVIDGTFQDVYEAKNSSIAAKKMWKNFTEHVMSHVPRFLFTMKNISTNELYHFEVTENKNNNEFVIDKITNVNATHDDFEDFLKKVDRYSNRRKEHIQKGGKRRKRYDDSSSSSDDYPVIRTTSPIAMFHYNPRIYYSPYKSTLNPQIVEITTPLFTPIFKPALNTFVGIWP